MARTSCYRAELYSRPGPEAVGACSIRNRRSNRFFASADCDPADATDGTNGSDRDEKFKSPVTAQLQRHDQSRNTNRNPTAIDDTKKAGKGCSHAGWSVNYRHSNKVSEFNRAHF